MVSKAPRVAFVSLFTAALIAACAQAVPTSSPESAPGGVWRNRAAGREPSADALMTQSKEDALAKSKGCVVCHQGIEKEHAKLNLEIEWFEQYATRRPFTPERAPGDEKKDPNGGTQP